MVLRDFNLHFIQKLSIQSQKVVSCLYRVRIKALEMRGVSFLYRVAICDDEENKESLLKAS